MKNLYHIVQNSEIWSPIVNLNQNEKCYYFISTYGRVYSLATNAFIIPHINHNGYLQVSLMTNGGRIFRKVHRLVMLTFAYFPGCETLQVNHKDANKLNNNIENLEWVTAKENTMHAINNNLRSSIGSASPMAKVNETDVINIYNMIVEGKSDFEIANIIGCNRDIIRCIALGKTWNHMFTDEQRAIMRSTRKGFIFPTELKHAICKYYQDNKDKYMGQYGRNRRIMREALEYNNLENNQFNFNIAHRLFYKLQDPEITSKYNY